MPTRRRIKGSPGTLAPSAPVEPSVPPPAVQPSGDRRGEIVVENGNVYVVSGTLKIRLDDKSLSQLIPDGKRLTSPATRKSRSTPEELKPAIEAAQKYRAQL